MTSSGSSSVFAGFRFPREVISVAVRWYLRYGLSYRDVEELLAERGVTVDHVTVYRWVQRFTPEFVEAARPRRHAPGDRWFVDETYVKVAGRWTYLYRAIDQHGQVIDVWLSVRRDLAAARRFFTRALRAGTIPVEVTTDRARPIRGSSTSWSPRPCTPSSSTRTTRSRPTTDGSKPGSGRCAASSGSGQLGSSPPVTPSCRTFAAATTTSPPTSPPATGSARPSTVSHSLSDRRTCGKNSEVVLRWHNATAPSSVLKGRRRHVPPAGAVRVQRPAVAYRPHVSIGDRGRPVHPGKERPPERFWLRKTWSPIVAYVGRLDAQKGMDLIHHAIFSAVDAVGCCWATRSTTMASTATSGISSTTSTTTRTVT